MATFKELFGNAASCALMSHFSSSRTVYDSLLFSQIVPYFCPHFSSLYVSYHSLL
ncbi:hypothetical protein DBV15_01276 [Temnothorax longispinosus]|uniref:Uncharacterized protein n=1 Tax=Temnothorax longispinosus TaxID=300112 RepID=A0A4V3SAN3_9HYME|nr:hypothetical protein DBV15_01276 [Temnothorax longispinosus]